MLLLANRANFEEINATCLRYSWEILSVTLSSGYVVQQR